MLLWLAIYVGQLLFLRFQFQFVMLGDLKAATHIASDLQWWLCKAFNYYGVYTEPRNKLHL